MYLLLQGKKKDPMQNREKAQCCCLDETVQNQDGFCRFQIVCGVLGLVLKTKTSIYGYRLQFPFKISLLVYRCMSSSRIFFFSDMKIRTIYRNTDDLCKYKLFHLPVPSRTCLLIPGFSLDFSDSDLKYKYIFVPNASVSGSDSCPLLPDLFRQKLVGTFLSVFSTGRLGQISLFQPGFMKEIQGLSFFPQ